MTEQDDNNGRLLVYRMEQAEAALKDIRNEMRGIRNVLVGLLVSVATASILLGANILLLRGGS